MEWQFYRPPSPTSTHIWIIINLQFSHCKGSQGIFQSFESEITLNSPGRWRPSIWELPSLQNWTHDWPKTNRQHHVCLLGSSRKKTECSTICQGLIVAVREFCIFWPKMHVKTEFPKPIKKFDGWSEVLLTTHNGFISLERVLLVFVIDRLTKF